MGARLKVAKYSGATTSMLIMGLRPASSADCPSRANRPSKPPEPEKGMVSTGDAEIDAQWRSQLQAQFAENTKRKQAITAEVEALASRTPGSTLAMARRSDGATAAGSPMTRTARVNGANGKGHCRSGK